MLFHEANELWIPKLEDRTCQLASREQQIWKPHGSGHDSSCHEGRNRKETVLEGSQWVRLQGGEGLRHGGAPGLLTLPIELWGELSFQLSPSLLSRPTGPLQVQHLPMGTRSGMVPGVGLSPSSN